MSESEVDTRADQPEPSLARPVRPKAHAAVTVHKVAETDGQVYYVLKQPERLNCLRLNETQLLIWEMLDGEHTLAEIEAAYLKVHRRLPDGLDELVMRLAVDGFLADPGPLLPGGVSAARRQLGRIELAPQWLTRLLRAIIHTLQHNIFKGHFTAGCAGHVIFTSGQ